MALTIHCGAFDIPAEQGETILEAMLRNGQPFPHSCEQGNCGTCRCALVDGDILELPHSEFALPPSDKARGVILACRTQVWGECTIKALSDEELVVHASRLLNCRVAEVRSLTHDIKSVRLAIESGGPYEFSAGQYAKLGFADLPPRDYSMANRPDEPMLEFHVRRVAGGAASEYVYSRLAKGEVVRASGPFGSAYLRTQSAAAIIAIAGGSGLAPIRAIVSQALNQGLRQSIHLYIGMRAERDIYLEAELEALSEAHDNFQFEYVLSEARGGGRRVGWVHEAVAQDYAGFDHCQAYLAGPPPMVEAASAMLLARGVPRDRLYADAFYTAADRPGLQ